MHSCMSGFTAARERAKQNHTSPTDTNKTPATKQQPPQNPLSEPDPIIAETMFQRALRDYLHDPSSYKPGLLRHGAHPKGYAFIQEFRAKNAFGAVIKQSAGFLAATNTGEITWTFYDPEQTPALLREVMKFKAETDSTAETEKFIRDAKSAPSPEHIERTLVIEKAKEYASPKLKDPGTFSVTEVKHLKHSTGDFYLVRFTADGRNLRVGVRIADDGKLTVIDKSLLPAILESSTPMC